MKNVLNLLIVAILLISCSKSSETDLQSVPQKFVLVKMTGMIPNSELTGDDMDWQEYYIFDSDSTFLKSREENNKVIEEEGTYKTKIKKEGRYLILAFPTDTKIIGSCDPEHNETLFSNDPEYLQNTWGACDGPVLNYKRVD